MKIALIASCAVLAGCAIQPYQLSGMGVGRVCYLAHYGGPQTSSNARAELARRNYSCTSQDVAIGHQQDQQHSADLAAAAAMMSRPVATPAPIPAKRGMYTGERVQGMNKICYYNDLGSTHAITIGATQLCPL